MVTLRGVVADDAGTRHDATIAVDCGTRSTVVVDLVPRDDSADAAPQLGISTHFLWEPYWNGTTPTPLLYAHLDALTRFCALVPNVISRVRFDVGWSASQPTTAPPTLKHYYNARILTLLELLAARQFKPLPVVHQSPPWSRSAAWDDRQRAVVNTEPKRFPDSPSSIGVWARWFAVTFSAHVDVVEFWNEPNLTEFAGYEPHGDRVSAATPARYMALLSAFAEEAQEGHPLLRIVAPNTSSVDWRWIEGCYRLGLGKLADAIGVHAYQGRQSIRPASVDSKGIARVDGWERYRLALALPRLVQTMREYGDDDKTIWNTEAGWAADGTFAGVGSDGVPHTWPDMNVKSAAYSRQWLDMLTERRDDSGPQDAYRQVTMSVLYQLFDPLSADVHQRGFNVIGADGSLSPQLVALGLWRAANPLLRDEFEATR